MNVGEYGVEFVFAASFDMSAETGLALHFTKPSGALLTVTNPAVYIQNAPLVTAQFGTLAANTYAIYVFLNGDVNEAGLWSVRLIYDDAAPQHLISNVTTFTVGP